MVIRHSPAGDSCEERGPHWQLPWLESLPVRAAESGKLATSAAGLPRPPVRLGCLFFSNGVEPSHWGARGAGRTMELGSALAPITPFREDVVFIRGLFNKQALDHPEAHRGRVTNLLSGAWVTRERTEIRAGKTKDLVLAQSIARQAASPSLALGVEPTELRLEDGYSMIFGSCISWASDTKPATKEIYPSRVFDLLVGDGSGRRHDRSILDAVFADASSLKQRIAGKDRVKLDEYLESVRDIELRIDRAGREQRLEGWKPSLTQPDLPRPPEQLPQNVPEHMKLLLDLVVLAFRMNKTRVATLMLNNDLSQMNFGFLDGVQGGLHNDLTHNGRDPKLEAMALRANQFHIEQFAYLLKRLKESDEGGTSVLDNSMLLCFSSFFDGDWHQADQLPVLLAGRGGGSLETGRVLDYLDCGNENRKFCSLHLSLMERRGLDIKQFGDADRPLADL